MDTIPTPTDWLNLPQAWAAFWPIISNPFTFGIIISIAMEQFKWIQRQDVSNAKKLAAVFAVCLGWSAFVALGSPHFTLAWSTLYSIIIMAVGVTASSQIGYLLISSIPWLKQILSVLFPKPDTTKVVTSELTYTKSSTTGNSTSTTVDGTSDSIMLPVS